MAACRCALFVFYHFNSSRLTGLTTDDAVLPFFATRELPAGISGLVIAAIFAASMAVMSAGINSLTTATTVDFYQRIFRPRATPERHAIGGRFGAAFWGLIATGFALFAKHLGALVLAYNRISSFISGPLLGIFLLGTLTKRGTASGSLVGACAGTLVVASMMFASEWSFFYLAPFGLAVTFAVGYISSLFMSPPAPSQVQGLVMGWGETRSLR